MGSASDNSDSQRNRQLAYSNAESLRNWNSHSCESVIHALSATCHSLNPAQVLFTLVMIAAVNFGIYAICGHNPDWRNLLVGLCNPPYIKTCTMRTVSWHMRAASSVCMRNRQKEDMNLFLRIANDATDHGITASNKCCTHGQIHPQSRFTLTTNVQQ